MTKLFVAAHGLIVKNDRYLVTRRLATDGYMPGKWDLPGGTVEAGETVEQGLLREVIEETTLSVEVTRPFSIYTNLADIPERETVAIIFLCRWTSGDVQLSEHDEYRWVTKDELAQLDRIHFLEALAL